MIIGPYLLLALLAWCHRGNQRRTQALLILNVLLALGGLGIFAAETADYRSTIADFVANDPGRGAEYIQASIQRVALFAVPALQWLVTVITAGALFLQSGLDRRHARRASGQVR